MFSGLKPVELQHESDQRVVECFSNEPIHPQYVPAGVAVDEDSPHTPAK
jgi:hypothetical protein